MRIGTDVVAGIHYTIRTEDGRLVDRSPMESPWFYLHGSRECPSGLEHALEQKGVGDRIAVSLEPEETYGHRREEAVLTLDRGSFPQDKEPRVGMIVSILSARGETELRIVDVSPAKITVDANHPLAGQRLRFEAEVACVRRATSEEILRGGAYQTSSPTPLGRASVDSAD